jgi:3-hydroxyisobutyrate dehydrogenase
MSLMRSGHVPPVFDLRPEATDGLDGITCQEGSAAEVARKSDVVLVAALDEDQVHDALTRPDGILVGARTDTIVVLLSTISVDAVRRCADLCAGDGVELLDCGVTPGDQAPYNGLVAFVGGSEAVVTRAMPVLKDFARAVVHCGPIGTGMTVKIARNVISYCTWTVVDEAVDLAQAAGVDRDIVLAALREADARDPQYLKMLEVRSSGFEVASERIDNALATAAKDLDAATMLADLYDVHLPLTEATKPLVRDVFLRNGGAR